MLRCCALLLASLLLLAVPAQGADNPDGPITYIFATDAGYAPWSDNEFENRVPSGLSVMMLQKICQVEGISCKIVSRPSGDCFNDQGVGPALMDGDLDGCLDWTSTSDREAMGLVFSNDYSTGPSSALITSPGRTPKSFDQVVNIGYVNGFIASPQQCEGLTPEMHNDLKNYVPFESTQVETMLAQLDSGVLDYVLWDGALPTLPTSGWTSVAEVQDGGDSTSIVCSSDGLALMAYPTEGNAYRSVSGLFHFNRGLAIIRNTGYFSNLCYKVDCPPANCILETTSSAASVSVGLATLFAAGAAYFLL